jgi:hypothetical protein
VRVSRDNLQSGEGMEGWRGMGRDRGVERSVDVLEKLRQKGQSGWLWLSKMVAYLPWCRRCQRSFVD